MHLHASLGARRCRVTAGSTGYNPCLDGGSPGGSLTDTETDQKPALGLQVLFHGCLGGQPQGGAAAHPDLWVLRGGHLLHGQRGSVPPPDHPRRHPHLPIPVLLLQLPGAVLAFQLQAAACSP